MTMLTKIGNSQGVRIPKYIIKQVCLESVDLEIILNPNRLIYINDIFEILEMVDE